MIQHPFSSYPTERQWAQRQCQTFLELRKTERTEIQEAWWKEASTVCAVCCGASAMTVLAPLAFGLASDQTPLLVTLAMGSLWTTWRFLNTCKTIHTVKHAKCQTAKRKIDEAKQLEVLQEAGVLSFREVMTPKGLWPLTPMGYLSPLPNAPLPPTDRHHMWGGAFNLKSALAAKREGLHPMLRLTGPEIFYDPFLNTRLFLHLDSLEKRGEISLTPGRGPLRDKDGLASEMIRFERIGLSL